MKILNNGTTTNLHEESVGGSSSSGKKFSPISFLNLSRILCLEIPLGLLLGILALTNGAQYFYDTYYETYMQSVKNDEMRTSEEYTYYHRVCTKQDFSIKSLHDLVVDRNVTDGTDLMLKHGSVIIPNVVPSDHAKELREYVLDRNANLSEDDPDFIWLISNEKRWSFKVDLDAHPSVERVVQDIARNEQIIKTLEDLLGPDPALLELTAITSAYGSGDQHFHKDNDITMTLQHMARTWNDHHTIFVPLQDTTEEMGATDACPGFHICSDDNELCDEQTAFRMADETRIWKAGDAWMFQASTNHRGPAHEDPDSGDRVVLILTFSSRPGTIENDRRIPSLGTSWSLKMQMSGLSLRDLSVPRKEWNWFRKFAAWGGLRRHSFDYVHFSAIRIINEEFQFRQKDLVAHLQRMNRSPLPDDTWFTRQWVKLRAELFGGDMPKQPRSVENTFELSQQVEVYAEDQWWNGVIHKKINDRTYLIRLEEDEIEKHDVLKICARGQCSNFLHWKAYVEECLHRMRMKCSQAVRITLGVYIVLVLIVTLADEEATFTFIVRSILRIVLVAIPFLTMVVMWLYSVQESQWGKDILSGHVFDRPFMNQTVQSRWKIPREVGPTILPYQMDVLIPTRLDSQGFGARNSHLEIVHPGNSFWKRLISQHAHSYSGQPLLFQDVIITQILGELHRVGGIVLLQNDAGNWIYLGDDEARKYTRRSLLETHSVRIARLTESIRRLRSELKYGRSRETAMSRMHTPDLLTRIEACVYNESESMATTEFHQPTVKCTLMSVHRVLRALPSRSMNHVPRVSRMLRELGASTRIRLDPGDLVTAFHNEEWLTGKIEKVEGKKPAYGRHAGTTPCSYHIEMYDGEMVRLPRKLVRFLIPGSEIEGKIVKRNNELQVMARVKANGGIVYGKLPED